MLRDLKVLLAEREIDFDANDHAVMCFGHIIDLCSGRVIKSVDKGCGSAGEGEGDEDNDDGVLVGNTRARNRTRRNPTTTNSATPNLMTPNVIAMVRTVVRIIRASGLRRDAFNEVIRNGNDRGWFRAGDPPQVVKVDQLQLL